MYPQAFDEQFHLGIIQVYAHHWLPFLKTQPPNADPYGAVTRDPSFLYHYLMSFPYRLIELFTHDQTIQIIILRFLNVGLFAAGLIFFRHVLRKSGLSDAAVNASLFIVALIPVAPQLAGQINYDNLLIPMTAWSCLLAFNLIDQLDERRFSIRTALGLLCVCLLASMVKYEFLPIFLAIAIFVVAFAFYKLRGTGRLAWAHAKKEWARMGVLRWLLVAALLVSFGLFAERDLGNLITYHKVVPDCSQVLDIHQCSAYSVWVHDYQSHQAVVDYDAQVNPNPIKYFGEWIYWIWYRLFFAIDGPSDGYRNYPPLPLPAAASIIIIAASIVGLIFYGRRIIAGRPYRKLLGVVVAIYLLTLFGAGYVKYLDTGVFELMNGRYLFPILLPGAAVAVPAMSELMRRMSSGVRYGVLLVLLVCFLEGGGVFTFIARSDAAWYWNNPTVLHMNNGARDFLEPVLIDGSRYYTSGKWFFN